MLHNDFFRFIFSLCSHISLLCFWADKHTLAKECLCTKLKICLRNDKAPFQKKVPCLLFHLVNNSIHFQVSFNEQKKRPQMKGQSNNIINNKPFWQSFKIEFLCLILLYALFPFNCVLFTNRSYPLVRMCVRMHLNEKEGKILLRTVGKIVTHQIRMNRKQNSRFIIAEWMYSHLHAC